MTHTLNRTGLSNDRPGEEIVFLCMVHQPEKPVKAERMKEIAQIVMSKDPDNYIGKALGLDRDTVQAMSAQAGILTSIFTDKGKAMDACREINEKKLGLSVVISALFDDVRDICRNIGLTEHTYNISLGVFGKTEQLPDKDILAITTQCGHHLVSPNLIRSLVKKIQKGKTTPEEAADLLAKPCVCGVVNPKRVQAILEKMAGSET